jgi:predicted DnaQ family exonuclease/DinG family helicase
MPHKPDTFVAVDLETTGLDPTLNEIIEIGAVKVVDGVVTAEFSELVRPEKPIPEFITNLTGITPDDVVKSPRIAEVLPDFMDFISGYRILGQNVKFDISFLRRAAGMGAFGEAVDNIEIARVMLPRLPSYSLESLIDFFGLEPDARHRALEDARMTALVFLKLIDMLRMSPTGFITELLRLSNRFGSALRELLDAEINSRALEMRPEGERDVPTRPRDASVPDNMYGDFTTELPPRPELSTVRVDPDSLAGVMREGGALSQGYDGYEERSGQVAMTAKVSGAFNDAEIILAEAGTGTGKSIAYLVPAVVWAESAQERVVISTNTKNLQEQLFFKDIPLIGQVLDIPFRAVILKGRGNYICLHRWQRLQETQERYLSQDIRALVLPTAAWLLETTTGDLSETGFYSRMAESGLLERISSDSISCAGPRCPDRDTCFVNRIRRAAQKAHIVIVNHSLVFSDMVAEGGVLGPYSRIVFDEAHNIEKVALNYLGVTISYYRIRRILNRLHGTADQGHGLLAMIDEWAKAAAKTIDGHKNDRATVTDAVEAVKEVRRSIRDFFEHLHAAVRAEAATARDGHDGKLRYDEDTRVFSDCSEAVDDFLTTVSRLIRALEDIAIVLGGVNDALLADREEVITDLEKSQVDLQAVVDDTQFLMEARGRNVFWFSYSDDAVPYTLKVQSAPLDIAEKLATGLYDNLETIVLTSATLTVARSFSYIRDRLGLDLDSRERVAEFIAASTFDYQTQSLVVMPTFLPSPKSEHFIDSTSEVIRELALRIRRGMLVLFTSRGHLHRAYNELRDPLAHGGVSLMAQGIDGSRNLLLRRFRDEKTSVLFGTDSFWEGVDVPGSALELLVIVRMPFAVPTEPVIQAQMEEVARAGGNPFMDFSVPEAAIKLRQGAGRLIRHRSDRGAVVVLDNRIVTTRYGGVFRQCLPGRPERTDSLDRLIGGIEAWFDR